MNSQTPTVDDITIAVCDYFDVLLEDILRGSRARRDVDARRVVFHLCYTLRKMSYPQIGRRFEYDHTTIWSHVKRVQTDELLMKQAEEIKHSLRNGQ